MESIFGVMGDHLKDSGRIIKCMGKGFMYGKMEGNMKGTMCMTRSKEKGNTIGLMVNDLRVDGPMENVKVSERS